jgi:hypothetical protein
MQAGSAQMTGKTRRAAMLAACSFFQAKPCKKSLALRY